MESIRVCSLDRWGLPNHRKNGVEKRPRFSEGQVVDGIRRAEWGCRLERSAIDAAWLSNMLVDGVGGRFLMGESHPFGLSRNTSRKLSCWGAHAR